MKLVSLALVAFGTLAAAQTEASPRCLGGWLVSAQADSITLKFNDEITTYRITPETELWRRGVDLKSTSEFVPGDEISVRCAKTAAPDGSPVATMAGAAMKDGSLEMEPHNIQEIRVCIGKLIDIQPSALTLKNEDGVCVAQAPPGADIWRGKIYHDTSALKIGDEVAVRVKVSYPSGDLIADGEVSANVTKTEGSIISVAKDFIVVEEFPSASEEENGAPKLQVTVLIDGDTEFVQGSAADLKKGVELMAIGLDLGPTQFRATRIWVYTDDKDDAATPPATTPR